MVLEFWYEFASTYSYPAAWRIERTADRAGVRVVWRPFLLGPLLLRQQGLTDSPFNLVPAKGAYMWRDVERVCREEMLPFRRPRVFPRRTLLAARIALVAAEEGWVAPFSRRVFEASFGEDLDISSPAVLRGIVREAGGDPQAVLEAAEGDRVKARLRAAVAEAEAKGLFGSPSFVCLDGRTGGQELFWGNDRLEQAVRFAAGPDHRE